MDIFLTYEICVFVYFVLILSIYSLLTHDISNLALCLVIKNSVSPSNASVLIIFC
jgi:hypothetical protein